MPHGAWSFCGYAKKSNDAAIQVDEAPAHANVDGKRKTVTALFADVKVSTELEQNLDPEEDRAIIGAVNMTGTKAKARKRRQRLIIHKSPIEP